MLRITAIISARNEAIYLHEILRYLHAENIDAIVIDNDSTDGTATLLQARRVENVTAVYSMPYGGEFDLSAQLERKHQIASDLGEGWIIHQDADEILTDATGWGGLRRAIERAEQLGHTVMNFEELVMLPVEPEIDDFMSNNRRCYVFAPQPQRLMRAWKNGDNLNNQTTAGHILKGGEPSISPEPMVLKHFIVRSQAHANDKYLHRRFAASDIAKGWHGNRLNLDAEALRLPTEHPGLVKLGSVKDLPSPMPQPHKSHYWHWSEPE